MSTGVRIVIGIDLGTTYSAAAWALVSDPSHIDLIRNWPSAGQLVGIKVPTEIAYPVDGDDAGISWGYSISPRSRKVHASLGFIAIVSKYDAEHDTVDQMV